MSGLQRALKIIACLWLIAFFSALPFSICTEIKYLTINHHAIQVSKFNMHKRYFFITFEWGKTIKVTCILGTIKSHNAHPIWMKTTI